MPFNCKTPGCHQVAAKSDGLCDGCHQIQRELDIICGEPQPTTKRGVYSVNVRTRLVEVPPIVDPVVEANRRMLHERSQLGIKKYGTTLAGNQLSHREWLQHALEEALDLANYLQAEIMKIDAEAADHKNTK